VIVSIIDLGINNLASIFRYFDSGLKGGEAVQVFDPKDNGLKPDLVVLPGMGNFKFGMQSLLEQNLVERLSDWKSNGVKILGVCLGMQLLGSVSEESPDTKGLDFIPGKNMKLPQIASEKIPNVGWSNTQMKNMSEDFSSLNSRGDYYFVHSFHFVPDNSDDTLASTRYGETDFISAIKRENILGFQFHPEKSGGKGKILKEEILEWVRNES